MTTISPAPKILTMAACLLGVVVAASPQSAWSGVGVLTDHYDYWRSGSNAAESILTPSSLSSDNFGVIATVSNLADTVLAQPLVVTNVQITCPSNQTTVTCQAGLSGQYQVVYVEADNTVYAINAVNGQILLQRNFGTPGPCGGIKSTPVINPATGTMYVIPYTSDNGQTITLHSISVGTLMDTVTPYIVTASNTFSTLTDGSIYSFNVNSTCIRSALLLLGGNIYAGFRGNEHFVGTTIESGPSRGWLLGWNASTLAPLTPLLTDRQATSTNSFFLSSIWMSGSGIASDGTNLYFITGNSDPSGTSYNFPNNIEESVVKVTAPNLTPISIFTPSNYATLDLEDNEIGSGGVAVIPSHTPLIVGGGKDGRMFLLNSASLGGYTPGGPDNVLDMQNVGGCWCAPSFFPGPDGIVRVVSSGGNSVITWKVAIVPPSTTPIFVQEATGQISASVEDPGFFTSVSSNGNGANPSRIIWAVGRPTSSSNTVTLYAFNATPVNGTLPLLGKYAAGTWVNPHNAYIVPVVANGEVFVVSGTGPGAGILTIFGLNSPP